MWKRLKWAYSLIQCVERHTKKKQDLISHKSILYKRKKNKDISR